MLAWGALGTMRSTGGRAGCEVGVIGMTVRGSSGTMRSVAGAAGGG